MWMKKLFWLLKERGLSIWGLGRDRQLGYLAAQGRALNHSASSFSSVLQWAKIWERAGGPMLPGATRVFTEVRCWGDTLMTLFLRCFVFSPQGPLCLLAVLWVCLHNSRIPAIITEKTAIEICSGVIASNRRINTFFFWHLMGLLSEWQ